MRETESSTRYEWLEIMLKIASPVIENLSNKTLKREIPVRFHSERREFAALEAFGRTNVRSKRVEAGY